MRQRQGEPRVTLQVARQARKEQTPAEQAVWAMLPDHRCGVHFRRQVVIGPFRLDFYCADLHLAFEIDGSIHNEPDVKQRDADRQAILEQEHHIHFLRVTNEDVQKRPKETRQQILAAIAARQRAPASGNNPLSHSDGGGVARDEPGWGPS